MKISELLNSPSASPLPDKALQTESQNVASPPSGHDVQRRRLDEAGRFSARSSVGPASPLRAPLPNKRDTALGSAERRLSGTNVDLDAKLLREALTAVSERPDHDSERPDHDMAEFLKGMKTPNGFHVSELGKVDILRRSKEKQSQRAIAKALGLTKGVVQAVIDASKVGLPKEGMKTPKGFHVSELGRIAILDLKDKQPPESYQAISEKLGLGKSLVQSVIQASQKPPPKAGMKTPNGVHVSEQGRIAILDLRKKEPPKSHQAIVEELGLGKNQVARVIAQDREQALPGERAQ